MGKDLTFRAFLRYLIGSFKKSKDKLILYGALEFFFFFAGGSTLALMIFGKSLLTALIATSSTLFGLLRLSYWLWRYDRE